MPIKGDILDHSVQTEFPALPQLPERKSIMVSLTELHPFFNHPFRVNFDAELDALAESIRKNGVYEIDGVKYYFDWDGFMANDEEFYHSGYRRAKAGGAQLAGELDTVQNHRRGAGLLELGGQINDVAVGLVGVGVKPRLAPLVGVVIVPHPAGIAFVGDAGGLEGTSTGVVPECMQTGDGHQARLTDGFEQAGQLVGSKGVGGEAIYLLRLVTGEAVV